MVIFWAFTLLAGTSSTVSVETAVGDWSYLPALEQRGYDHLDSKSMQKVYELASSGECNLPGESWRRLDLRVSFAAKFTPDGKLIRLVLPKLNCPEAEGVLGGALLEMIRGGDYRPTGANEEGWYRGNLGFGFGG